MRGVAGEDHAAVDELVHPAALEFVERDPFEIELVVPEHARDPRPHIFRPLLDRRIGIRMELQVDPPDVVRLPVQQRRAPGMKRRIEPEPALGRKFRRHPDVGDQELILEHLARRIPRRPSAAATIARRRRRRHSSRAAGRVRPASRSSARRGRCAAPARSPCCASAGRSRAVPAPDPPDRPRHRIAGG